MCDPDFPAEWEVVKTAGESLTRLHSRTGDGGATNTLRDREWTRSRLSADHFALQQYPSDQLKFASDEYDIRDLELGRVRAACLDGQIARAEAEQPVAEDVVRVLLDPHPERVVGRLASS